MDVVSWGQFGLAGTIAISLGGVIAYVFKLFVNTQKEAMLRIIGERDDSQADVARLNTLIQEQQRAVLVTLSDVTKAMAEVQQMLRDRVIRQNVEREFDQRREQNAAAGRKRSGTGDARQDP